MDAMKASSHSLLPRTARVLWLLLALVAAGLTTPVQALRLSLIHI